MGRFHEFERDVSGVEIPRRFTWPFHYVPHRLCVLAAEQVSRDVSRHGGWAAELAAGKMLGVLVVADADGHLGFLAAHSGNLPGGEDYFVPPIYDLLRPGGEFRAGEAAIVEISRAIERAEGDERITRLRRQLEQARLERDAEIAGYKTLMRQCKSRRDDRRARGDVTPDELQRMLAESQHQKAELKRLRRRHDDSLAGVAAELAELEATVARLKAERKRRSEALQERIFGLFVVVNALGERRALTELFPGNPPSGAGECCAPKLLQHAYLGGLRPVCMAEFWYGRSPAGEVRHHGHFYPACRSKCLPILTFMMRGLDVEPNPLAAPVDAGLPLDLAFDDPWMSVVRKPAGLLSTPGKLLDDSVEARYRFRADVGGPVVVHRLDQETSGLLLLAKHKMAHKALQQMFAERRVEKTYVALLAGMVEADEGDVDLPLRPDAHDRPRQRVDDAGGRRALTHWRVLSRRGGITRVELRPLTGRTHQLRVHASHPRGLNAPIVGDMLYGTASSRLMLHAERLRLVHPFTGAPLDIVWPAPF